MFCSKCGAAVDSGAKFCWKCGIAIVTGPSETDIAKNQSQGFGGLSALVDSESVEHGVAQGVDSRSPASPSPPPTAVSAPHEASATQNNVRTSASSVGNQDVSSGHSDQSRAFLGGSHHPWRRYFAKTLDVIVLGMVAFVLVLLGLSVISADAAAGLAGAVENQVVASVVILGLWIPMEAILLATIGNTPARALFGIKLRRRGGSRLSITDALARSTMVAIQGMGCGIPIVAAVTQYFAYKRLTRTGTTLWDAEGDCEISHVKWGPVRAVGCAAATVIVLLFVFGLSEASS